MDSRKDIFEPPNSVCSVSDRNIDSTSRNPRYNLIGTSTPPLTITLLWEEEQEHIRLSRNNHDSAALVAFFDSEYSELDDDSGDDNDEYSLLYYDGNDDDIYIDPASEEAIESMPKMKYEKRASCVEAEEEEEEEDVEICVVCQEALEQGEEVRRMPCCHIFHDLCIVPWLHRRRSCPQCRYQIVHNPRPTPDFQTPPHPSPIFNRGPSSFRDYSIFDSLFSHEYIVLLEQCRQDMEEQCRQVWEEHRWVREEELFPTLPRLLDLPRDPLLSYANLDCSSPVLTWRPLARVTLDYEVRQILTQGPFDDHWFELMITAKVYARKKHRQRFLALVFASRQRRRRKSVGSNENWNPKMVFRSNAIIKPKDTSLEPHTIGRRKSFEIRAWRLIQLSSPLSRSLLVGRQAQSTLWWNLGLTKRRTVVASRAPRFGLGSTNDSRSLYNESSLT